MAGNPSAIYSPMKIIFFEVYVFTICRGVFTNRFQESTKHPLFLTSDEQTYSCIRRPVVFRTLAFHSHIMVCGLLTRKLDLCTPERFLVLQWRRVQTILDRQRILFFAKAVRHLPCALGSSDAVVFVKISRISWKRRASTRRLIHCMCKRRK